MEEDIKILENFIQYNKFYKEENGKLTITIDLDVKTMLDKAIENLLTRYKQLEEENNKFRDGEIVTGKLMAKTRKHLFNDLKDYIHKSKVKEKIEELKFKLKDVSKRREKAKAKEEENILWCLEIRLDEKIKTLQELLES